MRSIEKMVKENIPSKDLHPIDLHVGQRLRIRREEIRCTQKTLSERIGVTVQQIQRYERGHTRISATILLEIAQILAVQIEYFFKNLPDGVERRDRETPQAGEKLRGSRISNGHQAPTNGTRPSAEGDAASNESTQQSTKRGENDEHS